MSFSIFIDIVVAFFVITRQIRIRLVPRQPVLRLPVILGVIGLIEAVDYIEAPHHHITGAEYLWVLGTLILGAGVLGAVRALTVRLWVSNQWVVRQGNWLTIALWVISLGLHFLSDVGAQHSGAGNFEASSFLLYIAITFGVQAYVVYLRARPLWDSLGPEAGQRLRVNFGNFGQGQGAGGANSFFATFRTGGMPPGWNAPGDPPPGPYNPNLPYDPNVIDAEVVDDDEPPQLH